MPLPINLQTQVLLVERRKRKEINCSNLPLFFLPMNAENIWRLVIKYFVQNCHLQLSGHLPDAMPVLLYLLANTECIIKSWDKLVIHSALTRHIGINHQATDNNNIDIMYSYPALTRRIVRVSANAMQWWSCSSIKAFRSFSLLPSEVRWGARLQDKFFTNC